MTVDIAAGISDSAVGDSDCMNQLTKFAKFNDNNECVHTLVDQKQIDVSGASSTPAAAIKANDLIRIDFKYTNNDSDACVSVKPVFTHQLFENETVTYLSDASCARVSISIQCDTLQHSVSVNGIESTAEINLLKNSLMPALPHDAVYHTNTTISASINTADDTIPGNTATVTATAAVEEGKLLQLPVGTMINTFTINSNEYFELYLATNKDTHAVDLLHRCEKIAMWFIETADSVDFANDNRWEVLFCYRVDSSQKRDDAQVKHYSFVGYITLFTFHNPFSGSKLRVCQALVLPHHHRKGIAHKMLLKVYDLASERNHISEVTVEDPCLEFKLLRDSVDCEWIIMHKFRDKLTQNKLDSVNVGTLSTELKLVPLQCQFVIEVLRFILLASKGKYDNACESYYTDDSKHIAGNISKDSEVSGESSLLLQPIDSSSNNNNNNNNNSMRTTVSKISADPEYKSFRLLVKRRLLKEYKELQGLDKSTMQKELDILFSEDVSRHILAKIRIDKRVALAY